MIRVRDYRCNSCDRLFEVFGHEFASTESCPFCGDEARMQLSAPRIDLEGTTGSFPGAAMRWERKREQHMALERRRERDHGDDGWR